LGEWFREGWKRGGEWINFVIYYFKILCCNDSSSNSKTIEQLYQCQSSTDHIDRMDFGYPQDTEEQIQLLLLLEEDVAG
jgi:hypothetical protein